MKAVYLIPGLLAIAATVSLSSCNKDEEGDNSEIIPYAQVNEQINLSNIAYAPLQQNNGTVAIPGGVRGILLVRQGPNQYFAFERNCTFRVYDSCAVVSTAPNLQYIEDASCCGSTFNFDGTVRTGPASRALLRYSTTLNGNLLSITN